jgi:hypothetical protein
MQNRVERHVEELFAQLGHGGVEILNGNAQAIVSMQRV